MRGGVSRTVHGSRKTGACWGWSKEAYLESGTVYGYHKGTDDLRDLGERCYETRGDSGIISAGRSRIRLARTGN